MISIDICERAANYLNAPLVGPPCAGYSRDGYLTCYNRKMGHCKIFRLLSTATESFCEAMPDISKQITVHEWVEENRFKGHERWDYMKDHIEQLCHDESVR